MNKNGFRPVAHEHGGEREAQQGDAAQQEITVPPSVMLDSPLCDRGNEDGAHSAAREQQREGESSVPMKPCEHGTRIRELRGPIRYQPEHKEGEIEPPDARPKSAERSE